MRPRGSCGEHRGEPEETLRRVRTYRKVDPDFESAIADFAEAEAELAVGDPVEGQTTRAEGPLGGSRPARARRLASSSELRSSLGLDYTSTQFRTRGRVISRLRRPFSGAVPRPEAAALDF